MRSVWPILKREYLSRVRSKAFWISTALVPLLIFAMTIVPSLLAARSKDAPEPIHVVDLAGGFAPVVREILAAADRPPSSAPIEVVEAAGRPADQVRTEYNALADEGKIQGYYLIDREILERGDQVVYRARNPGAIMSDSDGNSLVARAIRTHRLEKLGLSGEAVDLAVRPIRFDVLRATNDPKKEGGGVAAFLMSFMMVFFIYFTLIIYGIYVMRGVLEEKSNRIVEVIVSSVRPFHLMMGKIVGIGLVGLTQIAIWVAFAAVMTAPQLAMALSIGADRLPRISGPSLFFLPIYYVLGYFLFATIYAGIGSMFNSEEDAQQLMGVANIFLIAPMVLLLPVMKNPDGTMSTLLSLFPFFSPILMYLRIGIQTPPAWQIGLSIAIMLATIMLMIWVVAKIYRVGILMYGKKPTIPEILRWLRYT
ncbi:MAG TPA: ABC transporter permease [Thermoanaerobaculia bacterium]|nr:ABC transporter permease [Thermoanaerobaculia bacterium]